MARTFSAIVNTNSFDNWVSRTNELVAAFAQTVTIAANTAGDLTTGNGYVTGIFGATTLVGTTLRGGTVTTAANLTISSNVAFTGGNVGLTSNLQVVAANVSISSNSTVEVLRIVGNSSVTSTTIGGTWINTTANLVLSGKAFTVPVGNTSARPTGAAGILRYNSETETLEVYTTAWESLTSTVNGAVSAADVTFAPNINISSSTVQAAIVETYNEKVSKSGDTVTGNVVFNQSGGSVPSAITDTMVQLVHADGQGATILSDSFGAHSTFAGRRADGINAAKVALANDASIVALYGYGYDGNTYSALAGGVTLTSAQAWTNTAHGTALKIDLTPNGSNSTVQVLRLVSTGMTVNTGLTVLGATSANDLTVSANLTVTGSTSLANVTSNQITANVVTANGVSVRRAANTTVDGVSRHATSAEWRTGTDTAAVLQVKQVWDAAAEVTLTYSGSTVITTGDTGIDLSDMINGVMTLTQNSTLGQPQNVKVGQSGCIRIVQDGTGSRTLSFHADWEFASGTAPTVTTTAGANDLLFYHVLASGRVFGSLVRAVS